MLLRLLRRNPLLTSPQTKTKTLTHPLLRSLHAPSEPPDPSSFTVSYVSSTCGLPAAPAAAAAAAAASSRVSSGEDPDAVPALLRGYGFSDPQIASLLSKHPKLLRSHPDRTIRRKLDSLLAFGLPRPDLLAFLATSPALLSLSLERRLLPNLALLLDVLGSEHHVMAALRGSWRLLGYDLAKIMTPNVETLRSHGVPPSKIVLLATRFPWIITQRPDRFAEAVERLRELNMNPSSTSFVIAINAMAGLSRPTWHRKLALYRSLGWSDEQTLAAFARHPNCMLASDEKITRAMDFFRRKLLFDPALVARRPKLIVLSMDRTIMPRCAVLDLLISKGALRKRRRLALHTVLLLSERTFAERYVARHQEEVPEVAEAYHPKIEFSASKQQHPPQRSASHFPLVEFFSSARLT